MIQLMQDANKNPLALVAGDMTEVVTSCFVQSTSKWDIKTTDRIIDGVTNILFLLLGTALVRTMNQQTAVKNTKKQSAAAISGLLCFYL